MEPTPLLYTYYTISCITLFATALSSLNFEQPEEITNFYEWVFYGILWPVIVIKYFIRWIIKLTK